ncbi:fibronectin type III domain-containing protein [Roseateles sp. BYS87W]|uniref:Fibronectin type III domain-containing protein n=1 Tax=Pelomonas baiyunensis TaxID=3299026 RepID=A0ABW7GWJ1_9BURK
MGSCRQGSCRNTRSDPPARAFGALAVLCRAARWLLLAALSLCFAAPAMAAVRCSITWNLANTGTSSYVYTFTPSDYGSCDPGGVDGVYTDGFGSTSSISTSQGGSMATDLNTPNVDKLVYQIPTVRYTGTDSVTLYDAYGDTVQVTIVVSATAPGAPTIISGTAGNAQATVSFSAPAYDGASTITSYTVTSSPGGFSMTGASSPLTVTGLTNGVGYTFRVTATNAVGTGAQSGASGTVTPKAPQTITFVNPGAQNFGTTPTLPGSSDSGLALTFSSVTTGVCTTTSGGTLTFVTVGTCTIHADQAGNAAYLAATTVSRSFTVNAVVPGAPTVGTATAGNTQASVTFTAPGFNGGASITGYTVTASPGGATGTGAASPITVTGLTNGTAYTFTVTATNSAGTGSASAASNSATPKAGQTITFANPGAQTFGTTPTLTATSDSGLTVSFTSSTTGVCTITSGGVLTFVTAGTCTINADQAGNGSYLAATTVSRSFTVNAVVPGAPTVGTATSGNAQASVTFTAPASNGGASITGYTVTASPGGATGTGAASPIIVTGLTNGTAYTFTVTATNSAGTGSASAASNAATPKAGQTITFANPGAQNFGTTPTLTATSDSALTVSFTSSTPGVCTTTSGGALTFVTAGTCTINADQAGNGSYLAAATVSRSFTVNAVAPGAPTVGTATAGNTQASVTFTAPGSNGGASITGYTVTANPGGATGSGAASPITVTGLTNGTAYTFTVTATNSAGTGSASAASNVATPKAGQTITFANPGAQNFGTTPTLNATSDSALTPTFSSATTGVCTITSGGALTFVTSGTCTINADQAGNGSYLAAATVSRSFTVNAVVPGAPTMGTATAGSGQASVSFTAPASNGGSAITSYTVTSSPGGITASGAASPITVTGLSNGTTYTFTVVATNGAGTGGASAASNAVATQAAQTLIFANPGTQNFGTSPTLSATSDAGLTPSFSSATPAVCTVTAAGTLTFLAVGTCTISADQAGNASYLPAATVTRSFTVAPPVLTISPATLLAPAVAQPYAQTITMSGGTAPYRFSLSAGSLPAGLALGASTGTLSGTATAAGAFAFTVQVTDQRGFSSSQVYSFNIALPTLAVAPAGLAAGQQGLAYSQQATASGGLAPYAYSLSAGSLPAGVTLNAATGAISGTPTVSGTFNFTVKATDATSGSGPAQGTQAYTVVMAAGQPRAAAARVDTGYGTPAPVNLGAVITGGAATAVAVVSGPAHGTAVVSGPTTLLYTPAAGYAGPDSFTYSASNAFGASSATVTVNVGSATLSYAPAPLAPGVGGAAYSQSVAGASGGAAPYSYAVASGALPAGLSLAANGTLAGTPTAGGTFQFTVTATDSSTGAGPFRATSGLLTLTIRAATVALAPASLARAQVGVPYSQALSATGGNAPYSFSVSAGTLPPGLALNASTGALSGTPTAAGRFAFTVQASDSTAGAVGTGSREFVLTTDPALPIAGAKGLTVAFNTATVLDLAPALSGGPATAVAVSSAPAHGTVTVSGLTVTYTPTVGYTGTDRFSYTASNVSGTSAPAAVDVTVNPPLPVPQPGNVTVINRGANNGGVPQPTVITLTSQGGPVTGVTIVVPPAHGTVTLAGIQQAGRVQASAFTGRQDAGGSSATVTYTPNVGFVGTDSFTYTMTNAGGTSAPATVTIQVTPPPPVLGSAGTTARTKGGQPVVLAVAAQATGGPFTGLTVVSAPAEGRTEVQGLTLVYTPPVAFAGVATITFALSNAYGSTQGTATVTVVGRLDPSKDAEVGGLLASQADTARRFARSQLGNFNRRLESLHSAGGWGRSSLDLGLSSFGVQSRAEARMDPLAQLDARRGGDATGSAMPGARAGGGGARVSSAAQGGPDAGAAPRAHLRSGDRQNAGRDSDGAEAREPWAFWMGGGIDFGRRDALTGQERLRFHTDGVSLGADCRVNDRWTLGVGGGFGSDRADIGTHGSRSTARNGVVAVYGAWRPAEQVFVDGVLGYSRQSFDLQRYITDDGGWATGSRSGRQWFGSVTASHESRLAGGWMLAPYGRLEWMRATLAAYTETAADVAALSFADQRVRMATGKLGLRAAFAHPLQGGELQPRLRLEWQHQFEGTDPAAMTYADLGPQTPVYRAQPAQDKRTQGAAELGAKWVQSGGRLAVSVDVGTQFSGRSGAQQSLRLGLEGRF